VKTFSPKQSDIVRQWFLVDANNEVLGRLASRVAHILRGKHKAIFAPHVDTGDHVVIINAEKIRVTGKKASQKKYTHFTGYPGGLREASFETVLAKYPERVLEHAIRGMLPHNRIGRKMMKKLKIYAGETHPHSAQKLEPLNLN
jgi:large subunit ribosomal protein L13